MATARLLASSYSVSSSTYLTVTDPSNMYTDTDSTTYATVRNSQNGTTSYYIYIRGFDFDAIPSNAIVNSFSIKFKARESGCTTSTSYHPYLCNGTSQLTSQCSMPSTSVQTLIFSGYNLDWEDLTNYGGNFGIRINCRRSSRNTTAYMYIYGAEIEVDYTLPNPAVITSTLIGEGTIDPSGTYDTYKDTDYTLKITPTTKSETVSVSKDGIDVSSEVVAHYAGGTFSQVASSFDTGFSDTDANFYMSSSSTGTTYLEYPIGHSAENPYSTASNNTYVKDGYNNTATGWIDYSFDFSSIPADAIIDSVAIRCYGARENATIDSTHMAKFGIYCGNTLKGSEQSFTSTTNSIITISDPGTWTRAELQNAKVRFEVAYYGGHVNGISWDVTYHVDSIYPEYYTYTFTVTGDSTIVVVIGTQEINTLYVKPGSSWIEVATAYQKVSGQWVAQDDLENLFDENTNYIKG